MLWLQSTLGMLEFPRASSCVSLVIGKSVIVLELECVEVRVLMCSCGLCDVLPSVASVHCTIGTSCC